MRPGAETFHRKDTRPKSSTKSDQKPSKERGIKESVDSNEKRRPKSSDKSSLENNQSKDSSESKTTANRRPDVALKPASESSSKGEEEVKFSFERKEPSVSEKAPTPTISSSTPAQPDTQSDKPLTSTTNSQLEANHNRSIDPPGKSLQS
jgi:hypothetical protein